jgi:hypothetical protein
VKVDFAQPEARPAIVLADVQDASFDHLNLQRGTGGAPLFDLRGVEDFSVTASRGLADARREAPVTREKF